MKTQYVLLDFHPRIGYSIIRECGVEEDGVRHDRRSNDSDRKEEFGYRAKSRYD